MGGRKTGIPCGGKGGERQAGNRRMGHMLRELGEGAGKIGVEAEAVWCHLAFTISVFRSFLHGFTERFGCVF